MIQHSRNINMYPGVRAPERIHLSQYDSDFTLVFSLYSSAGSFSVESGTTAMVRGTKGDGNGYSASASLSGTTVTVQGNNQMTAVAGPNTYELVLTRSGKVLSTANFILDVEPAAMDANTIQSDTVLMELQAIIDSASVSTAAADRAEEAAEEAEGHANGTVRFDVAQSLTDTQKAQAKNNIGLLTDLDNTPLYRGYASASEYQTLAEIVTPGSYWVSSGIYEDAPIDLNGLLVVIRASYSYVFQYYFVYDGEGNAASAYLRHSKITTFVASDWKLFDSDIRDALGEINKIVGAPAVYELTNADFSRKARFVYGTNTVYPFTQSSNSFITYAKFELPVETGRRYRIKAIVPSQYENGAGMIIIPYSQGLLDAYNAQTSADTNANTNTTASSGSGGWKGLDQTLTIPNALNGEPCVGILLSFRQSDPAVAISDDFVINSVYIYDVTDAENEGNVARYDIVQNKTEAEKRQVRENIGAAENFYVTPQMFGAKGDGVTDDTVAFQSAIDSGRKLYVPMSNGQIYLITDTIVVSGNRQFIYGDIDAPDWAWSGIYFHAENKVLFDFKDGLQGCVNLSIRTDVNKGNTAIRFKKDSDVTNIDGSVHNCSFRRFDKAIEHYGRGLSVKHNLFWDCRSAIETTIMNEPRWNHQSPTDNELIQTYPEYNGRSLFVVDNRFHMISERYLLVISEDYISGGTTLKQVLNGAVITGNMSDIGRGSFEFKAPIKGCVFSNNEFMMVRPDVFFDCQGGASDCTIANNTIRGLIDADYPQLNLFGKDCFAFNGLEHSSINGNVVENFSKRCVYCYGNGLKNSTVIGNVFKNYGIDTSANQYERTGFDVPNCENNIISNNTFMTVSDFDGYIIRARNINTNIWKRNVFNDNVCTKRTSAEILVPTTVETEDNIIQGIS